MMLFPLSSLALHSHFTLMQAVRRFVFPMHEDVDTWLSFVSLCRRSGKQSLSLKTLGRLQNFFPPGSDSPEQHRVTFAHLKHQWSEGQRVSALGSLRQLVAQLQQNEVNMSVRCHLKLAEWELQLSDNRVDRVDVARVLHSLRLATELEPGSYEAWHQWALFNYQVVEMRTHPSHANHSSCLHKLLPYITPAVDGFFRSIALGQSKWGAPKVQQDILRLLTLWFSHGHRPEVTAALTSGFSRVSIDTWLQVVPQLIARIHTPNLQIRNQLQFLLSSVVEKHPQALIYPLSVALKSPLRVRQEEAEAILATMRKHRPLLVEQALLVSHELIRVAILWHEMWHEGLEEASRQFFGEHDIPAMLQTLEPLHQVPGR